MAIRPSPIDSAIRVPHQMSNLWDLYIEDRSAFASAANVYKGELPKNYEIITATLPFEKLETMQLKGTNQRFYSGHTSDNVFSIEFHESTNFKIYDYFDNWYSNVYDAEKQCFRSFQSVDQYSYICERSFRLSFEKKVFSTGLFGLPFVANKSYYIYDVKILNIDDLTLDYVTGVPLTFKVNFTFNYLDSETF